MDQGLTPASYQGLPVVSAARMRELDRKAIEEYRISPLFLMERAGEGVAAELERFVEEKLGLRISNATILVVCGRGNNGGDGLVVARLLLGKARSVAAIQAAAKRDRGYAPEVAANRDKALAAGVRIVVAEDSSAVPEEIFERADVIVDALLGTGSSGKPAGVVKDLIQAIRRSGKPVVSVDLPSGLSPDTGYHGGVFITAALTVTLGLPKKGLLAAHARQNVGELLVADIGLPKELLKGI